MGRSAKGLSKTQQDWINQGRSLIQAAPTFSKNDYPWRDEDLEFFTPQPLEKFLYEEMGGIVLFPKQREDLEVLLGIDPKQLFEAGSGLPQQALLAYGKGCLGADEKLKDYASGLTKTVEEWAADGRSLLLPSWNGSEVILCPTSPVYLKGSAQLYRITLNDGRSFVATAHHKCLSLEGWTRVDNFLAGHTQLLTTQPYSSAQTADSQRCSLADEGVEIGCEKLGDRVLEQRHGLTQELTLPSKTFSAPFLHHHQDANPSFRDDCQQVLQKSVWNGWNTTQDFLGGYHPLLHSNDEQPLAAPETCLDFSPSLSGVLGRNPFCSRRDGFRAELLSRCNLTCQPLVHHLVDAFRGAAREDGWESRNFSNACGWFQHPLSIFALTPLELLPVGTYPQFEAVGFHQGGLTLATENPRFSVSLGQLQRSPQVPTRSPSTAYPFLAARSPDLHLSQPSEASQKAPYSFPQYSTVKTVESLAVGRFYDLTVPITHNYFDAQGICQHNSGKDYMVSCCVIWSCHVLLCLKDIPVYLGQAPGENIDVLTVAYSMDQAKSVLFYKMKARLRACPWFNTAIAHLVPNISPERYLRDGNGFVGADSILFPGNLRLWSVPATDAAEGKNPILWCADEIAAFSSPVRMNQASHIHKILTTSARTRFGDRWKGLLLSYARHSQDYIMKLIAQSRQGKAPGLYVAVRPTWEVNLNVTRESLQPDYDLNPEDSACRYECNPPSAVDAYFRNPELLLLHAKGAPIDLLRSKLLDLPEERLLEIANKGRSPLLEVDGSGDPILDMRGFPKLARWWTGQKDLAGQEYEYYVHLDPGATGDSFGFAIGHNHQRLDGTIMPTIDLAFRWIGRMFHEFGEIHRQQWFPDTMAQTEIVTAAEIDFRTVREFIFFLRYARGFNIRQISMDNWNSVESRQELDKRGFQCIVRIVAKQDYDIWKGLVYSRQIAYYGYPILIEENYKLQLLHGAKVDAPRTKEGEGMKADSHKDVSDAVAAVARYLNFLKDEGIEFYTSPAFTDMGRELWDKDEENPTPLLKEESDLTAQPTLHSQVWEKFMSDED